MKKYGQAIGLTLVIAGVLVYPAIKLFQYIAKRRAEGNDNEPAETHLLKAFAPAFRGKHKPHHRSEHNGHAGHGIE